MKKKMIYLVIIYFLISACVCFGEEAATTAEVYAKLAEVYAKVMDAVMVLENLGEKGLEAFKDPEGEFVWKGALVAVVDCEKGMCIAHPNPKISNTNVRDYKCKKTGVPIFDSLCQKAGANGKWVEYWVPKSQGGKRLFRKITFAVRMDGTPYLVMSGIFNESLSIEELNSK
jgi:cytochrome c